MINVDISQLQHWIGALFWPFVRIGACLMVAPVFGASYVPRRLRIVFAAAITIPLAPLLPAVPDVALLSADGVVITIQQVLIGAALGFALQLVFDALTLGGQLLANGMGLGFAFNQDPLRGVTTPALGQLYTVLGTLVFLALDGHIALINTLADSFHGLPVGANGIDALRARALADWGGMLFLGGLRVALPGMTALLVINLAFGVMSRAAPALNLFAVGLPVTLLFGLAIVTFSMPTLGSAFTALLTDAFDFMRALSAPQ
ncbi:MAG: flagellar biosynthetic protein FliR [Proteobacteria bacterium]|nr:flagellar biosynthetic protein FliR [Pseudomonadota bacterium]